ncbi:Uncharacterised protein [Enterobacter cancerogenus]|uniref:Uncharacterized protein n=1 Tax=Enterobacter cancerogenus TaxID=69218 RepID=A0A484XQS7_9ENTR|nr:Uncharacterised protein [Enterobacter cancerogenus]
MAMIDIEENITSNAADILAIAEARAAAENLFRQHAFTPPQRHQCAG